MKAQYHSQADHLRIVQRGTLYYCQQKGEGKGHKRIKSGTDKCDHYDPWFDVGSPKSNPSEAAAVMYGILPRK